MYSLSLWTRRTSSLEEWHYLLKDTHLHQGDYTPMAPGWSCPACFRGCSMKVEHADTTLRAKPLSSHRILLRLTTPESQSEKEERQFVSGVMIEQYRSIILAKLGKDGVRQDKNRGWFGEVSLIAAAMNQILTLRMRPERIHSQA